MVISKTVPRSVKIIRHYIDEVQTLGNPVFKKDDIVTKVQIYVELYIIADDTQTFTNLGSS